MSEGDLDYFMRRSREEARRALTCDEPGVAAAHHGLAIHYSAKALMARNELDRSAGALRPAMPQMKVRI